ncbi:DUF6301 family protein [Streptomyces sp. Isolate_45]|uniref:DUF6301 family protein n=1 Tax=Streptomyces sp. Isolate_45 TaxID=2950111 RepID=UPI002481D9CC|nr:DUF6301 family protein [Streptomyces sp. Isolate_45]MDA5284111.1 DUF6301 family protein [Streptomyces sp. Isolate_45]
MTQWRALSDTELVEFATRLRSLDCTWELGATQSARRSKQFPRRALMIWPRWDLLDTGFDRVDRVAFGRGRAQQDKQMVERVRLRLTDYAGQWTLSLDAFVRMAAALRTSLGEPTEFRPGTDAEIHWAGADTTLLLRHSGSAVYLELVTNNRLALDGELRQMDEDEEGLL